MVLDYMADLLGTSRIGVELMAIQAATAVGFGYMLYNSLRNGSEDERIDASVLENDTVGLSGDL